MPDPKRERERLRTRNRRLEQEVGDLRAIVGMVDPVFASAFADLCQLAVDGCRRPDDLGAPIRRLHASSRAPSYNAAAYRLVREEQREQRRRSARLRSAVESLVDDTPKVNSV